MRRNTLGDFWRFVDKTGECWLWTGGAYTSGYGRFRLSGKYHAVHRLAYEMTKGPITDGLDVLHTCDVQLCVRPDHLYLGTDKENTRDREVRGRSQKGEMHYTHREPWRVARGERVATARLSPEEVRIIRERYAAGGITQTELAHEYHVSQKAIWQVVRGKSWSQVE